MKRAILDAVIQALEAELARQQNANAESADSAMQSAYRAESQRDTSGIEASYLAHGYAAQCRALARNIAELRTVEAEDFTGQEIDIGALVVVKMGGETDRYLLLACGGGTEVVVDGQTVTVITPESPLGKALMGNVEAGDFSIRPGVQGIILAVR